MTSPTSHPWRRKAGYAAGALFIFMAGAGCGAVVMRAGHPPAIMASAKPVPIAALARLDPARFGETVVTVKAKVAEAYGASLLIADGSGRTLIDMGPRLARLDQIAVGDEVTVQGRVRDGQLQLAFLALSDGRIFPVGRHGPAHHGRR